MMRLIMTSAMMLEASCHTLLDGATHVGGGTMVGLRQAFFFLFYLFSLISLGIVLAFKIYKKSCYLFIVSNLVLIILITLHFVLNLIFFSILFLGIWFHLIFILNLVIILLIAIYFVFCYPFP